MLLTINNIECVLPSSNVLILCNTLSYIESTLFIQCYSVTYRVDLTVDVAARLAIVDAIAVADVESFLGAVPPDCLLDKAGKHRGVRGIEGARIDAVRNGGNDVGTAARSIARRPIGVAGPEPAQNAGAVQKVVHQSVDGASLRARLRAVLVSMMGPPECDGERRRAWLRGRGGPGLGWAAPCLASVTRWAG